MTGLQDTLNSDKQCLGHLAIGREQALGGAGIRSLYGRKGWEECGQVRMGAEFQD